MTAHQTGQNYTAAVAFQVSGTVTVGGAPLAGVAFAATNGVTCTNSNASGQYSCSVPQGWSGSVTPSLSGYTFTPASRNYTNVTAHQTAQNYAAVVFQVSGTVTIGGSPLAGVAFAATNGGSCTSSNASGQYSCTVVTGWSGSVTPALSGYTFAPPSRSHSNVTTNLTGQDFTATVSAGSAAIYYIHADHLNTPRVITNQTSQVVWRWDQTDPFGGNVPNENPSGLGTFTCNLRLPGQYFDKESNTHYNYFRDYDPGIGRYIQSDPIGLDGGINTYTYAYDNPISFSDPDGRRVPVWVVTAGVGALSGGLGNFAYQLYKYKGNLKCINTTDIRNAVIVGGAAGALAPIVAQKLPGAIALGAFSNFVQYGLTSASNGDPFTASGAGASLVTGAVGGWIGGPVANPFWFASSFSPALSDPTLIAAQVTFNSLLRNLSGSTAGNVEIPPAQVESCGCRQ